MRLRIVTTGFLIFGVVLGLLWPVILGPKPSESAGKKALAEYAARGLIYFALLCVIFLALCMCAIWIMRQNRIEFERQRQENLKNLVEGSLNDHGKRSDDSSEA